MAACSASKESDARALAGIAFRAQSLQQQRLLVFVLAIDEDLPLDGNRIRGIAGGILVFAVGIFAGHDARFLGEIGEHLIEARIVAGRDFAQQLVEGLLVPFGQLGCVVVGDGEARGRGAVESEANGGQMRPAQGRDRAACRVPLPTATTLLRRLTTMGLR